MFKIGQKVVCVDGVKKNNLSLIKGEIYTCMGNHKILNRIRIKELGLAPNGYYWAAYPHRFRPLDYDFVEEIIKQVQPKFEECNV